mgnify:CR=1 FL=1
MTERIATFVEVYEYKNRKRKVKGNWQNAKPNESLKYTPPGGEERVYEFLNFIYSGATLTRTGDNIQAQLVLAVNQIAKTRIAEMVNEFWHVDVSVVRMNADFTEVVDLKNNSHVLARDNWLAASMTYDAEKVEVLLSSAIDAVGALVPNRILVSGEVGPLPVTGSLRIN